MFLSTSDFMYPNGIVEVGIPGSGGFSLIFTSVLAVAAYLGAGGGHDTLNFVVDPMVLPAVSTSKVMTSAPLPSSQPPIA